MRDFTPSDIEMREWIMTVDALSGHEGESKARYDRWLVQHERQVANRIADDMDLWNSIHDSNNQADSDWIRERYGASE